MLINGSKSLKESFINGNESLELFSIISESFEESFINVRESY